ncbi:MAG: carboxymuconolactone decarboxylase family protein [Chloroflexi bacterium]|nr:carboxymuconolactone decarboxylase family protein [Chloroflexota bacterium]
MTAKSKSTAAPSARLPARYVQFQKNYPQVFKAYDALGLATQEAGPLEGKFRALVKLAIAVGAQLEGAAHSHTRRALEAGCSADEICHVALLATTTLGFPGMMKTLSWVDDILNAKP